MTVNFFDDPDEQPAPPPEQPAFDDDAGKDPIDSDELIRWVHTTVIPLYQRSLSKVTWCPLWWEHSEAIFRLEVVRRAWEKAVVDEDPAAMSDWTIHHLDAHMGVLLSPSGPFSECAYTERRGFKSVHIPQPPLTVLEPSDVEGG